MSNKLELTWFGKDEPMHIEPRLLIVNWSYVVVDCAHDR